MVCQIEHFFELHLTGSDSNFPLQDATAKRKAPGTTNKSSASNKDSSKDANAAAAASAAKRRTTERLQPGKSKGNLMTSIQADSAATKESKAATVCKNSMENFAKETVLFMVEILFKFCPLQEWSKLTAPKLSLGTVLTSGFGVGVGLVKRHNFSDNSAESTPKVVLLP